MSSDRRLRLAQLLLGPKIVLLIFFVASTNYLLLERLTHLTRAGNYPAVAVFLTIWALALVSVAIAAWLPWGWLRIAWALLLAGSAFFGDLNFTVAKAHLTFYDAVLYWAERPHWSDAAMTYALWFVSPLIRAGLGVVGFALPPAGRLPFPRLLAAAPLVPFLIVSTLLLVLGGKGTRALPEQYNSLSMFAAIVVSDSLGDMSRTRRPVTERPGEPLARHLVLLVDESVRADFIDLNGARGVTPVLLEHEREIANFGYAVSGNNCSIFSNLALRFGGHPERLSESLRTGPSIWAYAHAAGFRTVYIDGQMEGGRLQNGMNVIERLSIDEFIQPDHIDRIRRDVFIAGILREILSRDERLFVYVNKRGTHFPYRGQYPDEGSVFVPDMGPSEPIGESRERLLNSFRNAIRWNTDGFFRELFREDIPDATFLYTSDHGQNLLDRGVILQCNSSDPHELEGLVPLLAITSDPELAARLRRAATTHQDRTTHFQLFATLLELMGYERDEIRVHFPRGLFDPASDEQLRFSYGPIVDSSTRKVRWREMPSDLRQLTR